MLGLWEIRCSGIQSPRRELLYRGGWTTTWGDSQVSRGYRGVQVTSVQDWNTGKGTGEKESWEGCGISEVEPLVVPWHVRCSKVWGCRESIHTRCTFPKHERLIMGQRQATYRTGNTPPSQSVRFLSGLLASWSNVWDGGWLFVYSFDLHFRVYVSVWGDVFSG